MQSVVLFGFLTFASRQNTVEFLKQESGQTFGALAEHLAEVFRKQEGGQTVGALRTEQCFKI